MRPLGVACRPVDVPLAGSASFTAGKAALHMVLCEAEGLEGRQARGRGLRGHRLIFSL